MILVGRSTTFSPLETSKTQLVTQGFYLLFAVVFLRYMTLSHKTK